MKKDEANPSPLGALGFGMTTVLFSLIGAGFFQMNSVHIASAIFLGGLGQLLAGILEYKRGNTFGFISFTMFGLFWITLVTIQVLPQFSVNPNPSQEFMGLFNLLWTIFAIFLFIATLKKDNLTKIIFGLVVLLFASLALQGFTGMQFFGLLGGWVGIVVGFAAIYSAGKQIVKT